jgi:UDP-glucuronate decarboxylase
MHEASAGHQAFVQRVVIDMKVLVTGGAGFIGSHLCERLVRQGHEVVCLDNFFTGRRENVSPLLDSAGFRLLRQDVCEPLLLEVDQIYNLACPASPVHYQYNPIKTIKSNVIGTLNMLGLARRVGARVLQASTSEIYGEPSVHPQPESYWGHVNPIGPRSCYDEGKRVAETLMTDYRRQHGVDIRIARIFNTYGPRMAEHDGRVVSNFIVQALRGEPLTLYGDGSQTRSFCYVDDLVEGLIRLMNTPGVDGPVNLGNPAEFSIRELATRVADECGRSVAITFRPLPQDDPTQRRPDIGRAQALLGWDPAVPLDQGLPRTVTYFRRALARGRQRRRHRLTAAEQSLADRCRAYGGPPD